MKEIDNIPKENLKNLYIRRKMTTYQIADYYKCSQTVIWKLLHSYNISLRKPGNYLNIPEEALKNYIYIKNYPAEKLVKSIIVLILLLIEK